MTFPVAILAGGLATRLRPITETIPKALVEVAGKPFIEHQLVWLRTEGVRDVVLCVGHLGERIRDKVGDGSRFGLRIRYSSDGDRPLGTGGALRRALPMLGDAFFVLYGDSLLTCSLAAVEAAFTQCGEPALMTVFPNEDRWDSSNVVFRNGQLVRYDKKQRSLDMRHIDYGLGVLSAQALEAHPEGTVFDLADVYTMLCERGQLAGFEVTERFYEIGSITGLRETEDFLSGRSK